MMCRFGNICGVKMKKYIFAIVFISNLFAQVDYNTEIQTIFNANCTSCHINGGAYQQGLDLSSYDSLMAGSNNGAVIVPGDHANSLLWQKVNSGDMPQNNPDLNSDEVDLIAQWIDEGALEVNNIDCYADDGTEGVELWGECYSIENTDTLNLYTNELTGSIPPEIGNLTNLTLLLLYNNQLTGSIPSEIGNLTNLTKLVLFNNQLTDSIPSEIGNLTNLTDLALFNNQLTGSILIEIGNLTNLESLNLSGNQLTGSIPSEIGNLTNLTFLRLESNQLTGEIPESICDLNIDWGGSYLGFPYFLINNNQLCPPYPSCIEDYVGEQDTTNCEQVSIIDATFPITYNLHNAYPNPFNPVTTLQYDLPENALVNITIYDMMGRIVSNLVSSQQNAGYKSIQWNATNVQGQPVSAGVYLYSIEAGEFRQTKKMVLLK
jgi:hypothetical protein